MYNDHSLLKIDLESGRISVKEIVNYYLEKIDEGKHLNAFLSVFNDEAISKAEEVDRKIKAGSAGKLAGMVIAVKDVLALKGKNLTCSSKILENFESLYTAAAVQRLL